MFAELVFPHDVKSSVMFFSNRVFLCDMQETCDLTGAAKLVILVNRGQFMTDNLDQVTLGSMLYCLVIRLPESEVWTPVFFGESGVGNRLMRQYMEGNRYFAEYEPNHRRFSMMEILSKPLDIAVQ